MSDLEFKIKDGINGDAKIERARHLAEKIITYGREHNFSVEEIEIALRTCFIESKFGTFAKTHYHKDSNADRICIFQYGLKNWNDFHKNLGEWYTNEDVQDNLHHDKQDDKQIAAFYVDMNRYKTEYFSKLSAKDRDNISFEEFIYTKHHDGPYSTRFKSHRTKYEIMEELRSAKKGKKLSKETQKNIDKDPLTGKEIWIRDHPDLDFGIPLNSPKPQDLFKEYSLNKLQQAWMPCSAFPTPPWLDFPRLTKPCAS